MADPLKQLDSVVKQLEQHTDEISSASALASTLSELSDANKATKEQVDIAVNQLSEIVTEISSYLNQSGDFSAQVIDSLCSLKFEHSTTKAVTSKAFQNINEDLRSTLERLSNLRSQSTENTSLINTETYKIQEKISLIESKVTSIKLEELAQIKEAFLELKKDSDEKSKKIGDKVSWLVVLNAIMFVSVLVLIAQSFNVI